ncbi:hypothetical protein D9758_005154 [Tetrapyrgos nigripes]|uniref:Uncharacterized protein n=1 Tax=Tetrapyrgos nigripes TaxID=182062 RepID=A0A8H5GX69_9AGAR|nr:hypothetical protein D9758_005154 [Tetrapyrgos nigripes]
MSRWKTRTRIHIHSLPTLITHPINLPNTTLYLPLIMRTTIGLRTQVKGYLSIGDPLVKPKNHHCSSMVYENIAMLHFTVSLAYP